MKKYLYSYLILFSVTSVFGYLMEVLGMALSFNELTDRGFLHLPLLPIYGIGSILIVAALYEQHYSLGKSFLLIFVGASAFEYLSSYLLEKAFHQTWWDYHQYRFNIDGRIALWSSLGFAFGGCAVLRYVYPLVNFTVARTREKTLSFFAWPLVLAAAVDFVYLAAVKLG